MLSGKKRGRPAKAVENKILPVLQEVAQTKETYTYGAFKILEKNGIWILYHGNNVREIFPNKTKALEYMEWIKA